MTNQIKALVILFLTVTFSAVAGQPTIVENDNPVVAIFKGFSEDKGFTFTVNEGEEAKELSFTKIDKSILKVVDLKDEALVGKTFELVIDSQDGTAHLKALKELKKSK